MKVGHLKGDPPKFYGSTTVGERGQVVIPAEARRDFDIAPSAKLLVFGNQSHGGLLLTKAESVSELINTATDMIAKLQTLSKTLEEEGATHGSD
ncbi:MAG: AbrB/MazE/SpoVT family DNA-binding domain-containing protein [Dehalococcoidia bacterium]|jgi:AbrB family looped-hinge helix DNA binding protein